MVPQMEQLICGLSSVRATDVSMETLSPTPVELTRGVEERETDSIGGVQAIDVVVVVVVPITGMLLGSSLIVGGPPFSNNTCSATISVSLMLFSHSLISILNFRSFACGFCNSPHWTHEAFLPKCVTSRVSLRGSSNRGHSFFSFSSSWSSITILF